jgi:hypothetical protein
MKRYDFTESEWHKYTDMMKWLIEHYGESKAWKWTLFEPRRTAPDAQWYIGTHRTKWWRRTGQKLCVWMPNDIYIMFMLRWL